MKKPKEYLCPTCDASFETKEEAENCCGFEPDEDYVDGGFDDD